MPRPHPLLDSLHDADFTRIFIECGWSNPTTPEPYVLAQGETTYAFREAAQMRGYRVFVCRVDSLPDLSTCRWLDSRLRRRSNDYLAIYIAPPSPSAPMHHLWAVPVTTDGKRQLVKIEYASDDWAPFLSEKLSAVTFSLDEPPSIVDVVARVNAAFLVNAAEVTKRFYRDFRTQHNLFVKGIQGLSDPADRDWYASVMLNRLMFCYFIQKRGFLAGDLDYLSKKLAWVQSTRGQNHFHSFYRSFLLRLFREGLDTPASARPPAWNPADFGRIPYLNGGMFAEHPLEKDNPSLDIPDETFERLFAFFDQWRWHLDTRLSATGRDINPDVLGYIFEQYINDRARMGAYYTKEDITEYISRSTILPWLLSETARKGHDDLFAALPASGDRYIFPALLKGADLPLPPEIAAGIPPDPPATLRQRRAPWNRPADPAFALPTEIWRETVARRTRLDDLRRKIKTGAIRSPDDFVTHNLDIRAFAEDLLRDTPDHLLVRHFYDALRRVTILDPTCGSGAFLFAALDILEPLYDACLDRMEDFHAANPRLFKDQLAELASARNRPYHIYKSIILRNLHGVDLMHEATEIARLRLFLKLVSAVDPDPLAPNLGLDPLPDIDFNIRTGNTLVGYTSPRDIDFGLALGDMFAFSELKQTIDGELLKISTANRHFRESQLLPSTTAAELAAQKRELQKRLAFIETLLNDQLAPRNAQKKAKWLESVCPFHWYAEFHDIMAERGGFDVIIGNPPYVASRNIDYSCTFLSDDEAKMPDIYSWCMLRSFALNEEHGRFGMIVPLSVTFSGDFRPLRAELRKRTCWISSFDNIPASIFDGVSQRCSIVLAHNGGTTLQSTRLYRWRAVFRQYLTSVLEYTAENTPQDGKAAVLKFPSTVVRDIAEKFAKMGFLEPRHSSKKLWFSTTARNYISAFLSPPPCLDVNTLENEVSSKISSLSFDEEDEKYAVYCACCGDFSFLHWLMAGDGFDVTKGNLAAIAGAVQKMDVAAKSALAKLGRQLDLRHFEGLSFKKNAGKYVGSFNYMTLKDITRRGDTLLLSALGFSKSAVFELFDWYVRILSINESLGEKGIPAEIRAMYPPEKYNKRKQKALFDEIDALLARHYGFTEEELDYIINYDIKYRMGDRLGEG